MHNTLSGWAALHQLAAQRGDGLHPKLLELAQRDQNLLQQGVTPLNVNAVSSGPAQQSMAPSQNDGGTVVRLPANESLKNTG